MSSFNPPAINIAPRVRFWLYIVGLLLLQAVGYLTDKGWAGDAEVRLATGLGSILFGLAAAKTDLSGRPETPPPDSRPVQRVEG